MLTATKVRVLKEPAAPHIAERMRCGSLTSERVTLLDVLELVDYAVVFPLPSRSKAPFSGYKWQSLKGDIMRDPKHRASLERARVEHQNFAVILGSRHGHVCTIDVDDEKANDSFREANPDLTQTLITAAQRGCQYWFRAHFPYPCSQNLTVDAVKWGEWRADGNYSVIAGVHPEGMPYRFINRARPMAIRFNEIRFPARSGSWSGAKNCHTPSAPSGPPPVSSDPLWTMANLSVEEVIRISLPQDRHQNHAKLFLLARAIRTIEAQNQRSFGEAELEVIFRKWHEEARSFLRRGQSRDDYYFEFLDALDYAKVPLGESTVTRAWKLAQDAEAPNLAARFESPEIKLLVTFSREMQRLTNPEPFFLAGRTVARLFDHPNHTTAQHWLRGLVRTQILAIVEKGGPETNRATRYRYLGNL